MKFLLTVMMMAFVQLAVADYLTKDSGEVCTIPDGFNTAPYDVDFNLKGLSEGCTFPHEGAVAAFVEAIENLQETGLKHPICEDEDGLVFGPSIAVRPCYQLIED
jgi:hypothetical protein